MITRLSIRKASARGGNMSLTLACASNPGQLRISPVSSLPRGFSMDAEPGHHEASSYGSLHGVCPPTGPPI